MTGLILAAALSAAPIAVDRDSRTVTFTATSTDCGLDSQLEFLFVGPKSDHGYEAMFVTDASVADFVRAFDEIGLPVGSPVDEAHSAYWPVGNSLVLDPAFDTLVKETRQEAVPAVIYTGGTRDANGAPEAETNMPSAVFALYNCAQSLLQLDDSLDQSATYGRFHPAVKIPQGERRTFKLTWKGTNDYERVVLKLTAGNMGEEFRRLKERSDAHTLVVKPDFDGEMTIESAKAAANALALIDSARIKINGFREGQFFYRAFLPREQWRDRKERLAQPPEIHCRADGTCVVTRITEDWSDESSLDPKLIVEDHGPLAREEAARLASSFAGKTFSILVFAPPSTRLAELYALRAAADAKIINWYVFTE